MKLNYLLPEKEATENCDGSRTKLRKHSWCSGGQIRKSVDGSVGAEFFCKNVKRDTGIFLLTNSTKHIKTY